MKSIIWARDDMIFIYSEVVVGIQQKNKVRWMVTGSLCFDLAIVSFEPCQRFIQSTPLLLLNNIHELYLYITTSAGVSSMVMCDLKICLYILGYSSKGGTQFPSP